MLWFDKSMWLKEFILMYLIQFQSNTEGNAQDSSGAVESYFSRQKLSVAFDCVLQSNGWRRTIVEPLGKEDKERNRNDDAGERRKNNRAWSRAGRERSVPVCGRGSPSRRWNLLCGKKQQTRLLLSHRLVVIIILVVLLLGRRPPSRHQLIVLRRWHRCSSCASKPFLVGRPNTTCPTSPRMSEGSETPSEEERSAFRPLTRESLATIEARIEEENVKKKELQHKKEKEGVCFFFPSSHTPHSNLPKNVCSLFPKTPPFNCCTNWIILGRSISRTGSSLVQTLLCCWRFFFITPQSPILGQCP